MRPHSITNPLTAVEQKAGMEGDPGALGIDDLAYWIEAIEEHVQRPVVQGDPELLRTNTERLALLRREMAIRTAPPGKWGVGQPDPEDPASPSAAAIVGAIDRMGDKIVAYYMKSVTIMERVYAHQLRNPGPAINIVEEHRNWNTYHVGGLLCNEGRSPGGVLAITADLRPAMTDVAIVVGSPSTTPLPDACLTKIDGWAMSVATAKLLVATVQQAIRDVEDATSKESHADSQDR